MFEMKPERAKEIQQYHDLPYFMSMGKDYQNEIINAIGEIFSFTNMIDVSSELNKKENTKKNQINHLSMTQSHADTCSQYSPDQSITVTHEKNSYIQDNQVIYKSTSFKHEYARCYYYNNNLINVR